MQRTLLIGLVVIMSVVVIGGGVAFRELNSAGRSVDLLLEGQKSLLLREQLRDVVFSLDDRLNRVVLREGLKSFGDAAHQAMEISDVCSSCHHDAEASEFITSIEDRLHEAVDLAENSPAGLTAYRAKLEELRRLAEAATRAGGDLVRKRAEAARGRLEGGRILVGTVALFSLGILAFASWWASRKIRQEVNKVVDATNRLVEHGADSVEPEAFRDEFRTLGDALRTMAHRLEEKERLERETLTRNLQAQRVLSLARFAGGIAHEVNNPLTGVVGFADLMLQDADNLSTEQHDQLARIRESGQRAADIIETLMGLSRKSVPSPEPVQLDAIVRHVVEGILQGSPETGTGRIAVSLEPARILADVDQIQQTVFCLLDNALRAPNQSGSVPGTVTAETRVADGRAFLVVSDKGAGIPQEDVDNVFDPFFTTREVGQGFGLGLAVSRQIVESHGGSISLTSEVGKGTTVTVSLPLLPPGPE